MKTYLTVLATVWLTSGNAWAQEDREGKVIHEAPPEVAPLARGVERIESVIPVSRRMAGAFRVGVNIHQLERVSEAEIAEADRRLKEKYADVSPGPERLGFIRTIEPGPLSVVGASVVISDSGNPLPIRTLAINSPGAYRIRLHFRDFDVGEGTVLVFADSDHGLTVRGPYTGKGPDRDGDFWTASLPGDKVFIEVTGVDEPRFEIAEIVHFDRGATESAIVARDDGPPLLECHLDVNCHGGDVHAVAKNATGLMSFSGGYSCTGTLLTDLDGETWVPYFITARHCLNTQAEVDTLEVTWFYESDACDGNVPNPGTLPTSVGGKLVKTDSENDMTFIRLNSVPPGVTFAGYTTDTSSGRYGVHHPKGSWKRVVFLDDVGACGLSCWCRDATDYDYYDRVDGLTQKGSSGSGVFNSSGQLAGQLYGVCSGYHSDGKPLNCGNIDDWTNVYGEFETSWSTIGWYLMIGGTVYVDFDRANPTLQMGTYGLPYAYIQQAIDMAWPELRVKIQAGTYDSPLTFDKPMKFLSMNGVVQFGQ